MIKSEFKYSGPPLIGPPLGHDNLVVLLGWSYIMIPSLCKLYHEKCNLIQTNVQ